jgi:hypothetical protein
VSGAYVVVELAQQLDNGKTEILVSIQLGHRLRVLSLLDSAVNLAAVVRIIFPDGIQIRLREIGVMLKDTPIG